MILTKMTALIMAMTALGVGSPLAAMAQLPEEDRVDTNLAGLIGIGSDVGSSVSDVDCRGNVITPRPPVPPIIEPLLSELCAATPDDIVCELVDLDESALAIFGANRPEIDIPVDC